MSSILPKDSDLRFPGVIVVDASAGSGKTTTLTRRLVQFLLSRRVPHNSLENILAITFTNNAAVEMKRRVLSLLKSAALDDPTAVKDLREILSLEDGEIQSRAREVLETILEQYSEFQVQTIDSFLARVFKASAIEFGFPPGFEIVIDSRPLLDEAFERFAGGIAEGTESARLIADLVSRLLLVKAADAKFPWNPYRELAREVKNLYGKIVSTARELLEEDHAAEYKSGGEQLCRLVEELGLLMDRSKVVPSVRFQTYRNEARSGKIDRLLDLQFPNPPVNKGKSPQIEFAKFIKSSEALCSEIESLRGSLIVLNAMTYFEPYIKTHRILRETLYDVKRRQGKLDLGDMTHRLSQFMDDGTVPDLYLSLGERIHHFLIDEFQDTAPIQWSTLVPLIENALSGSGSLFVVGDMKQSIYGFRGADWRIMKELLEGRYFPSAPPQRLTLELNYRSGQRILDFTKTVFHDIVPFQVTSGAAEASGLATFSQEPRPEARGKGLVETSIIEGDTAGRPERELILRIVGDCVDRGYSLRDLAVLTPENEDVVKVSGWLNEAGYEFIPFSTLDIRTRKVVGELLALIRFLDSPIDNLSFATFILGTVFRGRLERDRMPVQSNEIEVLLFEHDQEGSPRPLYAVFRERFPEVWQRYFDPLFGLTGYLPLYDLTTHIFKRLGVFEIVPEEEAALVKLLEVVQHFESRGLNSLAEFVEFAEEISEDSDWNIDVPPDVNAVRVMTVHKAKGLDFRVVLVLLYDVPVRSDRVYVEETAQGVRLVRLVKKQADEHPHLGRLLMDRDLRGKVDQLNKLYVALTRAKDEMYIVGVRYPQAKEPSSLLPEKGFDAVRKKPRAETVTEREEKRAPLYQHSGISDPGAGIEPIHLEEIQRGETIHAILARIAVLQSDAATAVRDALESENQTGTLRSDSRKLEKILARFLDTPDVRQYFSSATGRTMLIEQEFARADGQLFRMDRVVIDPDAVTVLDFKTGGEQKEHAEQVRNYMSILRDVFPGKEIRGVVSYVDLGICRMVA
jgi:ATP-dependent helicase/nuclease subunit A